MEILKIVKKLTMTILFCHFGLIKASKITFKNVFDAPLFLVQGYSLFEEVKGVKLAMNIFTIGIMYLHLAINEDQVF